MAGRYDLKSTSAGNLSKSLEMFPSINSIYRSRLVDEMKIMSNFVQLNMQILASALVMYDNIFEDNIYEDTTDLIIEFLQNIEIQMPSQRPIFTQVLTKQDLYDSWINPIVKDNIETGTKQEQQYSSLLKLKATMYRYCYLIFKHRHPDIDEKIDDY